MRNPLSLSLLVILPVNLSGTHSQLQFDKLHLARVYDGGATTARSSHYTRRFVPFIGNIENLVFDQNYLIDKSVYPSDSSSLLEPLTARVSRS